MTKLDAFVNHYAMWDKIAYDPKNYEGIKVFYTQSHGRALYNCYLCQFYENHCAKCPLKTCLTGSLYERFTKCSSPYLAKLIRDIIFKEYKNTEIFTKLKAYCKHYSMWDIIAENTFNYLDIKRKYTSYDDETVKCKCYLCDYYNLNCDSCPLKSCEGGSKYEYFQLTLSIEKAKEIRDIIFKDNFI